MWLERCFSAPAALGLLVAFGCGGDDASDLFVTPGSAGSTANTGGAPSSSGAGTSGTGATNGGSRGEHPGDTGGSAGTPGSGGGVIAPPDGGSGGSVGGTGGQSGTGGTVATGGASGGTGGTVATGGASGGTATGGSAGSGGSGGTGGAPEITAGADLGRNSCDRFVEYEAWARLDGVPLLDLVCAWSFGDGSTSSSCAGVHEFPTAGTYDVTVPVRDSISGGQTVVTQPPLVVYEDAVLTVQAEAPPCGLSLSYTTTKTFGRPGGFFVVNISPSDQVVLPPREEITGPVLGAFPLNGTVEVTAPGTYTIRVDWEKETNQDICRASASTEVAVYACTTP